MKRLILALYLVFVLNIGLTGCEQKIVAIDQTEVETQSSNLQIENNNNQKEEEKIKETATKEVEEVIPSVNLKTVNDGTSKEADKIPDKYKKYLGYWQLNNSDFKYNDVIRGFLAPLEIVSISNGVFKGNLTGRQNNRYSVNPTCTIEIQGEIKDNKVTFDFEEGVFGSGEGVLTLNDDNIEIEIKVTKIDANAPFSFEGKGAYKKIPEENLIVATTPRNLFNYLEFDKKEMVRELGKDFKKLTIDQGTLKNIGYYYPKYGLTFEFADEEGLYLICIYCDEKVEISGARSKMNFEQIQQQLGKQDVTIIIDSRIPDKEIKSYELNYRIYDTTIRFDSPSEDGKDSLMSLSK